MEVLGCGGVMEQVIPDKATTASVRVFVTHWCVLYQCFTMLDMLWCASLAQHSV